MGRERWKVIHWLIIVNFVLEVGYGFYMVFFVEGGGRLPLFRRATEIPVEVILRRRLYAIETWLAIVGLALYFAITEVLPRRMVEVQEESLYEYDDDAIEEEDELPDETDPDRPLRFSQT